MEVLEPIGTLERRKRDILDRWFLEVAETYPAETSLFLRTESDRFANPVGNSIAQGLEGLYDGLLAGAAGDELSPHLDGIVRIRAVQNFSPSEAVTFLFLLKSIVREVLEKEGGDGSMNDLAVMESRIDRLVLLAFDNFMACREKLFEIKIRELREMAAISSGERWRRADGSGSGNSTTERKGRGGGPEMNRGEDR